MSDDESDRTLSYEPQQSIDIQDHPEFPASIKCVFKNVERVIPSQKKLIVSSAEAIEEQTLEFDQEDMATIASFYASLHSKVVALPSNNHIFIFFDANEPEGYKGFVADDSHIHLLALKKSTALIVLLNITCYNRAIKLRGKCILPPHLIEVMESNPPSISQTARTINCIKAKKSNDRIRILNAANDESIVDNRRVYSTIAIEADDPDIAFIPVAPKFRSLLIAVNSALVAMDLHLVPRGRTMCVDEDEIKEIVCSIFENHVPREEEEEGELSSEAENDEHEEVE